MKENGFEFRNATFDDIDSLVQLESQVWGEDMSAETKKWESRISTFPKGVSVVAIDGKLVGVSVAHIINWDFPRGYFPTWAEASDNGFITNHRDDGNAAYGVDLTVLPKMPKAADMLVQAAVDVKHKNGLKRGYFGGRIPSLRRYVEKHGIKKVNLEVVERAVQRDLEFRYFMQKGFKVLKFREEYFPPDVESLGWGVILDV